MEATELLLRLAHWASSRYNQPGDECGCLFSDTPWFTQSAWVDNDCRLPVWHYDQLRAHHAYAKSDWKHLPEYCCQH